MHDVASRLIRSRWWSRRGPIGSGRAALSLLRSLPRETGVSDLEGIVGVGAPPGVSIRFREPNNS